MEIKHKCGCITRNNKDGILFVNICKRHTENKKYIWLGLKHKVEK